MKYIPVIYIILSVFLGVRILSSSLRPIAKTTFNTILGLSAVYAFNEVGSYIGVIIDINLFSVIVTALCGPPGIPILLIVKLLVR